MQFITLLLLSLACIPAYYIFCIIRAIIRYKIQKMGLSHIPEVTGFGWLPANLTHGHEFSRFFPGNHEKLMKAITELSIEKEAPVIQYGPLIFGGNASVVVCSPEGAREVLMKPNIFPHEPIFWKRLKLVLGTSLGTLEGAEWHARRKLVSPVFHLANLHSYVDIMQQRVVDFVEYLDQPGKKFNITEELKEIASLMLVDTVFGKDPHLDVREICDVWGKIGDVLMPVAGAYTILGEWTADLPFGVFKQYRGLYSRLQEIFMEAIARRRKDMASYNDVITTLINARDEDGNGMTDEEIRDDCVTIIAAGHETTSNSIAWTFFELNKRPDLQERIYDEIISIIGDKGVPARENFTEFELLRAVFREGLRMHSPPIQLARRSTKDMTIDGTFVPANTSVIVALQSIHFNRTIWGDDVFEFNPDRHLEDEHTNFAMLAFSNGPRICIGNRFALMSSFLIMAQVLRKYTVHSTIEHIPIAVKLTRECIGFECEFRKRK